MKIKIYSVLDKVLGEFAPPFVAKNDASASRNFLSGVRKMPYVKDLTLYCLGYWNPEDMQESCFFSEPYIVPVDLGGEDE